MFLDLASWQPLPRLRRGAPWRAAVILAAVAAGIGCGKGSDTSRHSLGDTVEAAVSAHRAPTADEAVEVTDDGGHVVRLAHRARRIISLIPSATETVMALGLTGQIVGRTRYDVDPRIASAALVGGGIDPSIEAIVGLRPDLVLAWENDKRQEARNKLVSLGVPVFTLRTEDTSDVFRAIVNIGRLTGRDSVARTLTASLHAELDAVRQSVAGKPIPRVLYVVFNDPPMTAGPKTFIGQLISLAGGRSIFDDVPQLWPNVAMEEIIRRQPDIIVVPVGEFKGNSVERFRGMTGWRDLRAVREGRVVTVPSDLLSRPGPTVGEAARVLRAAFHPEFTASSDSVGTHR